MSDQTAAIATRRFQCRHLFTDGHRCGSPCLRGEDFCFYHQANRKAVPATPRDPGLPKPEHNSFILSAPADLADRSGIQQAIAMVCKKLANNELDPRRAGLLLYALQIASHNLPRTRPVPATPTVPVEDVTHDPDHGCIAEPADFHEEDNRPETQKSSIVQLLVDLDNDDPFPSFVPAPVTLRAAADQGTAPLHRLSSPASGQTPPFYLLTLVHPVQAGSASASPHAVPAPGQGGGTRNKIPFMNNQPAKPSLPTRKTGLSPQQQKLQAMLQKAEAKKSGAKPGPGAQGNATGSFSAKNSFAGKKTAFQRKAT